MKNGIALLLAAGSGRKFWPYSLVRNKCAFPIANEPIIVRLAKQVHALGFRRIVVVTGHEEASIRAALRPLEDALGVVYARQTGSLLGTAPAALTGIEAAGGLETGESALVIYGDSLFATEDLAELWSLHREQGAKAVALCAPLKGDPPQDWIGCNLGEPRKAGGRTLTEILGHSPDTAYRLAGAYAFGAEALGYLRAAPSVMTHVPVGGMPEREAELAEVFATMREESGDVVALEAKHPCVDLDKRWQIFDATEMVLTERAEALTDSVIHPSANVSDGAEIEGAIFVEAGATIGKRVVLKGPAWVGKNAQVINGAIVGQGVVIGAETRVRDYCLINRGSVIGNRCIVGHGGEMDGVMLDGSYIYHYSEIYGVLGLSVDIGAATVCGTLRFDDGNTTHRIRGRRETPRNGSNATYFGDYSRTGVNVITQPGATLGAYSCVGAGIVLYDDVPDRKLVLLKQETITKDWGPERYGW